MRKRRAWAERLRARWLELVLLGGFLGLAVWFGLAALPMARSLIGRQRRQLRPQNDSNRLPRQPQLRVLQKLLRRH